MAVESLGIVADDLTGAMDSSGYFAAHGWETIIVLDAALPLSTDVVVLTTNSRADSSDIAVQKVRQAVRKLAGRAIFKKIDSTLRGNIAAELDAALAESGCEKAIVCPAFPVMGRTVAGGVLLVNGVPVAQTPFARDPVSPVRESHIPTLLRKATSRPVGCVGVSAAEQGAQPLYQSINAMTQEIIVCDAVTQSHLSAIAQAAELAGGRWLLCGSGGLAREVRLSPVSDGKQRKIATSPSVGDALVVIGSRHQVAAEQLRIASGQLGMPVLHLDFAMFKAESVPPDAVARMVAEARHLLGHGKGLAISAASSEYASSLRDVIPVMMAEAVAGVLERHWLAGVFLTGGDIAGAVCQRLGVSAIQVWGEIEPGIPAGALMGGAWPGMRVVTKAGGFGTPEALVKSITYLKKGRAE